MQTLVFCALYNLSVNDISGDGIELPFSIKITNNNSLKNKLIPEFAKTAMGEIEYNYLFEAPIFYKIIESTTNDENKDDLLCDFLGYCKIILHDLWQIKDNSVDIQLGYLCYPFNVRSELIIIPGGRNIPGNLVHSNLISTSVTTCKGKKELVHFDLDEIKQLITFDEDRDTDTFSETNAQKTQINSSQQKITLAQLFAQMARANPDLAVKISLYCTALECLFTTDTKELSHKTAERSALLIGENLVERKEIYNKVKGIYDVRSQVLHGSAIGQKTHNKLETISENCDSLLRRIFQKLDDSPELDIFYRKGKIGGSQSSGTLDEYFLGYFFGSMN